MAGSFSEEKLKEYIEETEKYILPLTSVLKNAYPEYSDISFLIKYQIIAIIETAKYMLMKQMTREFPCRKTFSDFSG